MVTAPLEVDAVGSPVEFLIASREFPRRDVSLMDIGLQPPVTSSLAAQRFLSALGIQSPPYLQGIDTEEIIAIVHSRRGPMMSATAGLQL